MSREHCKQKSKTVFTKDTISHSIAISQLLTQQEDPGFAQPCTISPFKKVKSLSKQCGQIKTTKIDKR